MYQISSLLAVKIVSLLITADICWFRLDFETFTILGPDNTAETDGGVCKDKLTITVTTGQQIPEVCGTLTGQHSTFYFYFRIEVCASTCSESKQSMNEISPIIFC